MKFTKEMQDRIIKWVELNGLYPQPCGATLQSLCEACGIDWKTFKKWEQKSDFSERLTCARAKFAATVEVSIVNSLVRNAQGCDIIRREGWTGTIWSVTTTPAQYHAQARSPYWKLVRYGHATRNSGGSREDMIARMMRSTSRQRITYSFIYVGEENKERLTR